MLVADPGLNSLSFGAYGFAQPTPQPGNWLTAGLASGWHQGLGALGGAVEAGGQALGMPDVVARGRAVAEGQAQQAQVSARPDLEQAPWYQPSAIGYRLAQMIPSMGIGVGGAVAGGALAGGPAGAVAGGAAAMYPLIAGSNVEAAKQADQGQLSSENARRALMLAAPEAIASGFVPGRLTGMFEKGVVGSLGARMFKGAAGLGGYNAALMGGQEALQQQTFTPDMPLVDRARGIVDAAMSGALGGGVFGGLTAALRPATRPVIDVPPAEVTNEALTKATAPLALPPPRVYAGPGGASFSLDAAAQAAHEQAQQPVSGPIPSRSLVPIPGEGATDQGGAPLYAGREGVGISPDVVERSAVARAGVAATTPPSDQPMLPPPSNVSQMTDAELQAEVSNLAEKAKRPARGIFKGGLGSAQAGQYAALQEEVTRRTPPGATPGPGFLTFSSEEAQQRAGQVADFKAQVGQGLPPSALNHGFFQNFNSVDEPDLINALRQQKDLFDQNNDGRSPKWFKQLADKYGVMDRTGGDVNPSARVEDAGKTLIATAKQIEQTRDPAERQKLTAQFKTQDLPAYRNAQQVEQWHDEADERMDAVRKGPSLPPSPTGDQLLNHPVIADRLANLKIDATGRVPDAAGVDAKDPSLVHVDSRIPAEAAVDGVVVNMHQAVARHEIPEAYGAVDNGWGYDKSHMKLGEVAEKQYVQDIARANGKDPEQFYRAYSAKWGGYIKDAAKPSATPLADVAKYPYVHDRTRAGKEEMTNAVREQGTTPVDVRQAPTDGGRVAGAHPEGDALAGARENAEGDAPFSYLDKFFPEEPEPGAPEKLIPNLAEPTRPGRVLPDLTQPEAPNAEETIRTRQAGERARLQMMHDAEQEGSPRQAFMARALVSKEPFAIRNALKTIAIQDDVDSRLKAPRSPMADRAVGAPTARFPEGISDWVKGHVKDTQGEVVYDDGKDALIRGFDVRGDPVYFPANRALDRRSLDDIDISKAPWLTPKLSTTLKAAADMDRALNSALARRRPDGPFTGREGQTVGTPSVDSRVVSYIGGLMKQLGLGDLRTLVVHPDDTIGATADKIGLNGDYMPSRTAGMDGTENGHMRFFGPKAQDAYIYVRPGMSDAQTVETAAHEVGHIIDEVALRTAPAETRAAVDAAYDRWYRRAQGGMTLEQMYLSRKALTSAVMAKRAIETGNAARTMDDLSADDLQYHLSKKEWFADQVARWATMTAAPRTILDKFFSAVARKMRVLASIVTGHSFLPDDAVREFLNHLGPGSDQQWLSMDPSNRLNLMMQDRGPTSSPRQMEASVKGLVQQAEAVAPKLVSGFVDGVSNLRPAMRKIVASLASTYGIRDGVIATKVITGIRDHFFAVQDERLNGEAKNKVNVLAQQAFAALPEATRGHVQQFLLDLQQVTARGVNPFKDWSGHTDLHTAENSGQLAALHVGLRSDLDRIRREGGLPAMDAMLTSAQSGKWQELAAHMWKAAEVQRGLGVELGFPQEPPGTTFRNDYMLHNDVRAANAFWGKTVMGFRELIGKKIADTDQAASTMTPEEAKAHRATVNDLRMTARLVDQGIVQAKDKTYMPVQHGTGNYFASARLATDAAGKVKPEAIEAMRKMAEAGDWHFGMYSMGDDQARFFTRLGSQAKQERFVAELNKLQQAGHLDPGTAIKTGNRESLNMSPNVAPYELQQVIERLKSEVPEGIDPKTRMKIIQGLTDQAMDMLPDHSLQHFLQRRDLVHGYDPNMANNLSLYQSAVARRSSKLEMSGRVAAARGTIIRQVEDAKANPNFTVNQKNAAFDLAQEVMAREAQQPWRLSNPTVDAMQAGMHSIVIGFNPAYFFTVMSQIPTLGWGELAKVQGFGGSAKYIAGASTDAFKAMRAIATSPDWANVGMRESTFRNSGLSANRIQTLMKLDAAGGLTSTFTRAVTDLGDEGHAGVEKFRQYANFMGTFSETAPRIMMAFASADAHDANPGKVMRAGFASREDYVKSVVNSSQMEWGPEMASRFTGKAGMFGPYGKLAFAFTRFHTMWIEKMYREMHDLLGAGSSAETKRQAGTFLAAHLVAVTALAGTLGLPMAAAFTGAADRVLNGLTGRDDVDVEGLYRTWLAHTFGAEVGDVLAKGVPRALGVDFSHLGDQRMLPGTSLIADKRKLEDWFRDTMQTASGPAMHEASSIFLGGRDLMNGDYLLGLTKMLPEGFKGVAEALYAGTRGFIDKYGMPIPGGQPSAADLAKMAVGLDPTTLARYNEARNIYSGLMAQREFHEQNIQRHIVRSLTQNDPDGMQYWIGQARDYTVQHPLMGSPLFDIGQTLRQHMMESAIARATGTPIGVKPLDQALREATGFLNPQ